MSLAIQDNDGNILGRIGVGERVFVADVTGPVTYDSSKGLTMPIEDQPASLTIAGLTVKEVRRLQGKRVAIIALDAET